MRRMSEATLIAAARRGEATAFDSLHRAHAEKLIRTVQRITRNHQDAEDAAQDSFLRAFTNGASAWAFADGRQSARSMRKRPSANQESCVTSTGAAVVNKLAGLSKPQLGKRGLIATRQSLPIWSYAD